MSDNVKIRRALLSVSDKSELIPLGQALSDRGVELIASGGTARALKEAELKVTPIENVTGNPEAFGGRMKTLSFQVSSSLLFRRDHSEDINQAKELGIEPIDLVVCNLYPYREALKAFHRDRDLSKLIENIDVGGPTMVRSGAKNFQDVCVLTSPDQYAEFIEKLKSSDGQTDLAFRQKAAVLAFRHLSRYDTMVAQSLGSLEEDKEGVPSYELLAEPRERGDLRYGENPHQKASVVSHPWRQTGLVATKPLQGKPLSYNNYLDADAALRSCRDLLEESPEAHAVTVIKHLNPCGASVAGQQSRALDLAWEGDPISSFGSIIAFSHPLEKESAEWLSSKFVEILLSPSFTPEARDILSAKKNLRLLEVDPRDVDLNWPMVRSIDGGWLLSDEDTGEDPESQVVTHKEFDLPQGLVRFGVSVTKHLRSNAIGLVFHHQETDSYQLIGAGMGNPNRLVSLEQAVEKAQQNGYRDLSGALLVSDAFFPFDDGVRLAHKQGIRYILQPGGSKNDTDVIETCNELGISMMFSGRRHFRH